MTHPLAEALLRWYADHARPLPWRHDASPYAVWVSEVMLQQTRVETVVPFFQRWMDRFPSLRALAGADLQEVLAVWEGLGYYRRARNLHRAAQMILTEYAGRIPRDLTTLERLPGIGRYTAAAIAAFAFGQDVIALDGNLRRVLARLSDLEVHPRTPDGERRILAVAQDLLPPGDASAFNQAVMDLGATVCTPRQPDCGQCPLTAGCLAFAHDTQSQRPVRRPRRATPHRQVAAAVVHRNGRILICRRPEDRLYGGLWEFPGGKQESGEDLVECLQRELREELALEVEPGAFLGVFEHTFTHFSVSVHAFECRLEAGEPQLLDHSELAWVLPEELGRFPMGKVDRDMARMLGGEVGSHRGGLSKTHNRLKGRRATSRGR